MAIGESMSFIHRVDMLNINICLVGHCGLIILTSDPPPKQASNHPSIVEQCTRYDKDALCVTAHQ